MLTMRAHSATAAGASGWPRNCGKCAASAIDNPSQATELYRSIHAFFAEMGLQMPSGVSRVEVELLAPLDLAARMALPSSIHATGSKDAMQEQFSHLASWHDGGHGEGPGSQAEAMAAAAKCNPLGLTSLDWREMAADSAGAAGGLKGASRKGAVIDPTSLSVRSVALVTSLPKDLCAVTLAHEFGHVFLHLSGIATPAMSDRAAEGLCELFSYLWKHRGYLVGEGVRRSVGVAGEQGDERMSSTAMASGMPSPRIVPAAIASRS